MSTPANDNTPGTYQSWRRICISCGVEMTIRDTPQCWDCLCADAGAPDPELDSFWAALLADVGKIRPRRRRAASADKPPSDHPRW